MFGIVIPMSNRPQGRPPIAKEISDAIVAWRLAGKKPTEIRELITVAPGNNRVALGTVYKVLALHEATTGVPFPPLKLNGDEAAA